MAYAERWAGRDAYFASLDESTPTNSGDDAAATTTVGDTLTSKDLNDQERLQRFKERGRQSDEKVKQIKDRVQRHFEGQDISHDEESADDADDAKPNSQMAKAAYDQECMTLLEHALCDAFCDVDAEILREVQGMGNVDANSIYGEGYCPDAAASTGVGHLPREVDTTTSLNEKSLFDKDDDVADADHPPSMTQEVPTPSDEEDAGTTAIVVLLTPKWIVCANSGDSRAIYSKSNHRAVPLSYDHKPEDEDEERRIREAGGFVSGGRVEGDLAVSRGLGDFRFKDMHVVLSGSRGENRDRREVTFGNNDSHDDADEVVDAIPLPACKPSEQKVSPVPDIIVQNRDGDEDEFVVIACDGIWDVQTNQECVQMVADIFSEGESDIGLVCEEVSLEK